jgi:hypothetical protein
MMTENSSELVVAGGGDLIAATMIRDEPLTTIDR